jgi:hypothetical protein
MSVFLSTNCLPVTAKQRCITGNSICVCACVRACARVCVKRQEKLLWDVPSSATRGTTGGSYCSGSE